MEEQIIYVVKDKLAQEYHNYLSHEDSESMARLNTILELSNSIKSLNKVFNNEKYSEFFKYIEKVEKELYK